MNNPLLDTSIIPSPLDDPTCIDPLQCPSLRWGILGCGRVCHDFTQALKHIPTATVVACSTHDDIERAQTFATKHKINRAYNNYDDLLLDNDIDIIYIGNVHSFRRTIVEKCLLANKHVLVEKPFACTLEDTIYLIQLAKERNLFMIEGMWTRYFPIVEKARQIVFGIRNDHETQLHKGVLGEVVHVISDFNFNASDSEIYPTSFFYNRKLGGGATLLTGPYPIAASTLFFNGATPDIIKVTGQVDTVTEVDLQAAILLSFPATCTVSPALDNSMINENTPKLPGSGIAILSYGILGESEETTTIVGTKGRMTIETPCHCPTNMKLRIKAVGRGNATKVIEYNYPLPIDTKEIIEAGGYYYTNSAGFCYEAAAVARCIAAGKIECPQYTLSETIMEMKILDQVQKQLSLKTIYDD